MLEVSWWLVVAIQIMTEVMEVQVVTMENTDKYKYPEDSCSMAVTHE